MQTNPFEQARQPLIAGHILPFLCLAFGGARLGLLNATFKIKRYLLRSWCLVVPSIFEIMQLVV
jgi:hypothetical protein